MDVHIIDKTLDDVLENGLDNAFFDFEQLNRYINGSEKGYAGDDFMTELTQPVDQEQEAVAIEALVKNVTMDMDTPSDGATIPCQQLPVTMTTHQHQQEQQQKENLLNVIMGRTMDKRMAYHPSVVPNTSGLPESPPDSGSEHAYSPPDIILNGHYNIPASVQERVHNTPPTPTMYSGPHIHNLPPGSTKSLSYLSEPPKVNYLPQASVPIHPINSVACHSMLPMYPEMGGGHTNKKRKYSDSPNNTINSTILTSMIAIKQENAAYIPDCLDDDHHSYNSETQSSDGPYQAIKWQAYDLPTWVTLCDANYKELPTPSYRVDSDKGFNMSVPDDAFICQKKNHFQVTVHIGIVGQPKYVKTPIGFKRIDAYFLHFNGIKMEAPNQIIKIEQSQSDRSKKALYPIEVKLTAGQVAKFTIGRLHFSETTANNMRKKGKPNPDQRYFMLVVSLHAHCGNLNFVVASHVSEKIIIRASNPGQFESDVEVAWQKGVTGDMVYHIGRVGVNTDHPDEALTVHGNAKVTGHVIHPSDKRVKENINEVSSRDQLKNVSQMKIYQYNYTEQFSDTAGLNATQRRDTGVIAQEVREVLPDAVLETGDVMLEGGHCINNLLMVNKDRIFMENVGAVKELCKLTDKMEYRIEELERMNKKLSRLKKYDSIKSTSSGVSVVTISTQRSVVESCKTKPDRSSRTKSSCSQASSKPPAPTPWCNSRFIQTIIILLIVIMAFCLISITVLYLMERQKSPPHTSTHHAPIESPQKPKLSTTTVKSSNLPSQGPAHKGLIPNTLPPRRATSATTQKSSRIPPVYIREWPSCSPDLQCEIKCCSPVQHNPGGHHLAPSGHSEHMMIKPDNHSRLINPEYVVPPSNLRPNDQEIEIQTVSSVNSAYSVNNNEHKGIGRGKRFTNHRVPILLKEMNFSLSESGLCVDPTECSRGNYTFKYQFSNKFSLTRNLTLEFSIPNTYIVNKCATGHAIDCQPRSQNTPLIPVRRCDVDYIPLNGKVQYVLPIMQYQDVLFRFRIGPRTNSTPCCLHDNQLGRIYQEYNLHFMREPCRTSAAA